MDEALRIGLVNEVTDDGEALRRATELAQSLAGFPQEAMRNDRLSVYEQWDLPEREAIANEIKRGRATIASGETLSGSQRFAGGAGRHGVFEGAQTPEKPDE
jgi:enoyl-CoA hydratase